MNAYAASISRPAGSRSMHQFDYITEMMQIALDDTPVLRETWVLGRRV